MEEKKINIGDLVQIKKKLQRIIALPDWGIVLNETVIVPTDVPEEDDLGSIESFIVFFPSSDETLTIPKSCLTKITAIEE